MQLMQTGHRQSRVDESAHPSPRLLQPGLRSPTASSQRYRVPANGSLLVELNGGDRIRIVDTEGASQARLLCLDDEGRFAAGLLGTKAAGESRSILSYFNGDRVGAEILLTGMNRRGVDRERLTVPVPSIPIFGLDSIPGQGSSFDASESGFLLIVSIGDKIQFDDLSPGRGALASDLVVWIDRHGDQPLSEPRLPDPLAEPRDEIRVLRRTAQSYEVKAGEYIQIIDVEGRECTDFQAFDTAMLDAGVERPLDMTVTRSMIGAAYPGPGLAAKYFNADLNPLIEVVRDTVGRHDTFGLACTARYYEDLGYFGHANCSDNFSLNLASYGVGARAGWEAVNFFYNTGVDDQNALYMDEPWSRPGDYVLLRALTDLVCVTSACPDDTTPANGWNPTDIHVRVYPAKNNFSRAIDFRMTPDADPVLTRETGFHARTSALTEKFVEYRGFWLPTSFDNHGA